MDDQRRTVVIVVICAAEVYRIAQQRVFELQNQNVTLTAQYRSGYDLEEVRSAALALGMIPVEEAQVMNLHVTVPVKRPEPTFLEDMIWFLEGLFA